MNYSFIYIKKYPSSSEVNKIVLNYGIQIPVKPSTIISIPGPIMQLDLYNNGTKLATHIFLAPSSPMRGYKMEVYSPETDKFSIAYSENVIVIMDDDFSMTKDDQS